MAKLECRRCGLRLTVADAEMKFGMDCPECHARSMQPRVKGGRKQDTPLGGIGSLPMSVVRPLAGAPIAAGVGLVMLCGGLQGMIFGAFVLGFALYLLFTGLGALARHGAETVERKRRYRDDD